MFRSLLPLPLFFLAAAATAAFAAGAPAPSTTSPYRYAGVPDAEARALEAKRALPSLASRLAAPAPHRLALLTPEDLAPKSNAVKLAARAGVHRPLAPGAALEAGRWQVLDNGQAVWRMAIQSPGAAGLRIHFRDFDLGGGRVWLHDGSGVEAEIMGPYEDRGIYGDREFWTDFVLSDTLIVEYQPAAQTGGGRRRSLNSEALPFTIAEIAHLLPGVLPEASPVADSLVPPPLSLSAPGSAVSSIVNSLINPIGWAAGGREADPRQAAAACHLDISCFPEWAETARAVAHIVYEDDGSTYVCSGTLLSTRTRNNIPYFLTADHCVSSDVVARTVQSFWQYQTTRCNGPAANKRDAQRTLGARYLVSDGIPLGDYSLVRLNSVPAGVIFSGWSTDDVPLGADLVGIHHPTGDYKRFSRGQRIPTGVGLRGSIPGNYFTSSYGEGLIEGGSSGSGLFTSPGVLVGMLSSGPKSETPCSIKPFPANYGRFSQAYAKMSDFLEGRTTTIPGGGGTGGGGTGGGGAGVAGQALTSGVAREFNVGPVTAPTLLNGDSAFTIDVPAGATRLEVRITSIGAEPELGFWVRYESAPAIANGRVVADHVSPGTSGFELVTIDTRSSPALRPGRYYIALGLFSTNTVARGTITATVTGTPAPTTNFLVSGQPRNFSIGPVPSSTLVNGANGFRIEVPAGARRLDIKMTGNNPALDVDLFVRFGTDATIAGANVTFDHSATGDTGNEEIAITQASSPPLRPGTYFIAFGLIARNATVSGTITATITGGNDTTPPPTGTGTPLTSGTPVNLSIPSVPSARLVSPTFQIFVPAGATRLDVRLSDATAGIDYDLFVRRNSPPEVQNGSVVADYRSTGDTGNELVSITSASSPALLSGSLYYVSIGVFTNGRDGRVTLTATVTGGAVPTPPPPGGGGGAAAGTRVIPGAAARLAIPAADVGRLISGNAGYYVTVPAGTQRLELTLASQTPDVDLDLFVSSGTPPAVVGGKIQAEYRATGPTGNETIVITQPQAGNYFVGVGVFTTGVDIAATLSASTSGGSAAAGPIVLQPGVAQNFTLPAVSAAQLVAQGYVIDVPENAVRVELRLASPTPGVDIDLYARFGSAPAVSAGKVQADHLAEGATGTELITITRESDPALRAGRYFVSLGVFTTGVAIDGTLVATVVTSGGSATPPPAQARVITPQSPVKFNLPATEVPTLFMGDYSFRVVVPEGTRRMQLRLSADTPSVDTDLFVRYEADNELVDGQIITDHAGESVSGNELVTVDGSSEPPLRPGTYFVSVGNLARNTPASGTISVTFERDVAAPPPPPASAGRVLTFGQPAQFNLPAVADPVLYTGDFAYRIDVPSSTGRLEVTMRAADSSVDVDLYLRYGAQPALEDTRAVADHRAQGDTGDETLVVTQTSNPALRAGSYFLAFGLFTRNRAATGTITATFTPGNQPTGGVLKEYDLTPQLEAAEASRLERKSGHESVLPLGLDAKYALTPEPVLTKRPAKQRIASQSRD